MAEKKNILIVGAGKGGTALIELFKESEMLNIACVVDTNQNAQGIQLAKKLGIKTCTDYKKCLEEHKIDEIINVTGSEKIQEELLKIKPSGVEVVGGHSAEFMWELIEERKKAEEELKKKMHDLESFHKLAVGRELKMEELKARIEELEAQKGGST